MSWTLVWTRPALKDMKKIEQRQAQRIREAVKRFAETGQGDVKKLTDVDPPEWRQRVGNWRVFLQLRGETRELYVLLRAEPQGCRLSCAYDEPHVGDVSTELRLL